MRVEDELKNLREVMEERFEKVDERFEAQQDQMDKRFNTLQWTVNVGFIILAALIGAPLFF